MRVIVVGARGQVGRAILQGIARHREVTHVVSLTDDVETTEASILEGETPIERRKVDLFDDLSDHFKFADAAAYVGWPVSDLPVGLQERQIAALTNICRCIGVVGVRVFVYGSSAGVYSSAPPGRAVDEAWPTLYSTPSAQLSQLVRGERAVDRFEEHHPLIRVVRLRAGVVVSPTHRPATIGTRILRVMTDPHRRHFVPDVGPYVLQCVHVDDFVSALCLGLTQSVNGPFNIAADPITSDLLAVLFAAKKVRIAPPLLRRILKIGSQLHILPGPTGWVELALRPQVIDTARAERELHWAVEHPARSLVTGWIENRVSATDRLGTEDARGCAPAPVETAALDLGSLYAKSLAYFGDKVHAIPADQWGASAGAGLRVWQLVATVALDQYRLALVAHGDDDRSIESQLPGDPLGIAPADGWDLAAERGSLAVASPDGPLRDEDDFMRRRLEGVLPRVIVDTIRSGSELGCLLGMDTPVPPELARFTEGMEPPGGGEDMMTIKSQHLL